MGAVERDAEQAQAEHEADAAPALQRGGVGGVSQRDASEANPAD